MNLASAPTNLEELRNSIDEFQGQLLGLIADAYLKTENGVVSRILHSKFEKPRVIAALKGLGGSVVFEAEDYQSGNRYQPTLLGLLLAPNGKDYEKLLVVFFEFAEKMFREQPEKRDFEGEEIAHALGLDIERSFLLFRLIRVGHFYGGSNFQPTTRKWGIRMYDAVDDLPAYASKHEYIFKQVLKSYDPQKPMLVSERHNSYNLTIAQHIVQQKVEPVEISHSEMSEHIMRVPPMQRDAIEKFYIGKRVRWKVMLSSATKISETELIAQAYTVPGRHALECHARPESFVLLSHLPEDGEFILEGTLSLASRAFCILNDCVACPAEATPSSIVPTVNKAGTPNVIAMKNPTAFTSYSRDNESHKAWAVALATRLRKDGVDVKLDQWSLVPGDQLTSFMEREIRENDYVLIVCTPNYKQKSDNRKGGVGYEGDIMTAEVFSKSNHRKFIPILASGSWEAAAPSWISGKYFVDLSAEARFESQYLDLLNTIHGRRATPPPLGPINNPSKSIIVPTAVENSEDIKIQGVIVDEVSEPKLDGSPGSALYRIPFRLSRRPTSIWTKLFLEEWHFPSQFTTMHRPEIASIRGDTLVLDGTTIDEVKRYHRNTLQLCVDEANRKEREVRRQIDAQQARERQQREAHRDHIRGAAKDIQF